MAWKEQIHPASFRGVPFFAREDEQAGGRRLADHQYPLRDKPYSEDVGRAQREWTLTAFVVGNSYLEDLRRLQDALEKPGPGRLVHPWWGELTVTIASYRVRQSTAEGGMAVVTIQAKEAGHNELPTATVDTASQVQAAADSARLAAQDDFATAFTLDGQPEWVATDAVERVTAAMEGIEAAASGVPTDDPTTFAQALADTAGALVELVRDPSALAASVTGLTGQLASLGDDPAAALQGLRGLFGHRGEPAPAPTTPARTQQASNAAALDALVQRAALIDAADTSSRVSYASGDDAEAGAGEIASRLDDASLTATDTTYRRFQGLRLAVLEDAQGRAVQLPRVRTVTPTVTQPALVLAYRATGSADDAETLINRNRIEHPGFVPGGAEIELLVDA